MQAIGISHDSSLRNAKGARVEKNYEVWRVRFHRLDLNLLVALDALIAHRNVTRAAEQLCLSQSALSGSLARLREHFKDDLVVQVGRTMVLTPLAESLAAPLRDLLLQTEAFVTLRSAFDPATSERRFTISGSDYVTEILLLDVIQQFVRQAPSATIVIEDLSDAACIRFERGDIEMILMPTQFAFEGHPHEAIFEERYVCVVWSENRLVGDALDMELYLSLRHVVRSSIGPRQSFEEWFLSRYGHVRRIGAVAPSFTRVPQAVIGTDLVATVHERLARRLVRSGDLRIVQPPIEFPVLSEAVQWHRHLEKEPGIVWFRGLLREAAGRLEPTVKPGPSTPRRPALASVA